MSAPVCENPLCGHERGLHYIAVETGIHGRCVKTGCTCRRYVGPEFGKPEALATLERATDAMLQASGATVGASSNDDAREMARDAAVIELRLLIAAVHDVVLAPAPRVRRDANPEEHLHALHEMTRHKAATERLIFSLGNARKALEYFDRLGKRP